MASDVDSLAGAEGDGSQPVDARAMLAEWANEQDDWVRETAAQVLSSSRELSDAQLDQIVERFLIEKGFEEKPDGFQATPKLALAESAAATEDVLELSKLSDVAGVNALAASQVLEFDSNLTVLFGQNGAGKTGYSRVLKRVAAVRTAEDILPNAHASEASPSPCASIEYLINGAASTLSWANEAGIAPLTRMSVFDAPAVSLHVDTELNYVFTPREIALFGYVASAVRRVQERVDTEAKAIRPSGNPFLAHFDRGTSVYPKVETIGATTDLAELTALKDDSAVGEAAHTKLAGEVDALKAGNVEARHDAVKEELERVSALRRAATSLAGFNVGAYEAHRASVERLQDEYRRARTELFAEGELAGPPDDEWNAFIAEGDRYRRHLGRHDYPEEGDDCIYCGQALSEGALALVRKYRTYLDDALARQVADARTALVASRLTLPGLSLDVLKEHARHIEESDPTPAYATGLARLLAELEEALTATVEGRVLQDIETAVQEASNTATVLATVEAELTAALADLSEQKRDRVQSLATKEQELAELTARRALGRHLPAITEAVKKAKRAAQLESFAKTKIPAIQRSLTLISKQASEDMVNRNFASLFEEERRELNAPTVGLEFQGRRGQSERRKVVAQYRPSAVLSEGELKVLAIADFLAECRMTGVKAPIVFDDPVTSLDYLRLNEVAERISRLADTHQVIVFTHNIFFASTLLGLRDARKLKYRFYEVRGNETEKGVLQADVGPRQDTPAQIAKRINKTVELVKSADDSVIKEALVERAYGLLRAWCEAFVEQELLANVTQRHRSNLMMGGLDKIKLERFADAKSALLPLFDRCSRFMPGHSQSIEQLNIKPGLDEFSKDWDSAQKARAAYIAN